MAAGSRVAGGDLQADAGQAEVGAGEIVGQVERAELEWARTHPFGPRAIDPQGKLGGRIGLPGDLDRPGGEADLLLLGEAEEIGRRGPVDGVVTLG